MPMPDYLSPEMERAMRAADRRRVVFHGVTDLRAWVNDMMGSEACDRVVAAVAEAIRGDVARPAWGRDWADYLETLPNLWEISESATGPDEAGGEG